MSTRSGVLGVFVWLAVGGCDDGEVASVPEMSVLPDAAPDAPFVRDVAPDAPFVRDAAPDAPFVRDAAPDAPFVRDAAPDGPVAGDSAPDVAAPDAAPDVPVAGDSAPDVAAPDAAPDASTPDAASDAAVPDAGPPRTWYVAAAAAEAGDGSEASPFPTVGAAVERAGPGDTILVAAGRYPERVSLEQPGVRVAGGAGATLVGDGEGDALALRADGVVVSALAVEAGGARVGVRLNCDDCALRDCEISGARGPAGAPGQSGRSAFGVRIDGGARVRVEGCTISDIVGGAGGDETEERRARAGSLAAGIYAVDTVDLLLSGNVLSGSVGGMGGAGEPPGPAGNGEQVLVADSTGAALVENVVREVDAPGRGVGLCVLSSNATRSAFNDVRGVRSATAASGILLLFTDDHRSTNDLVADVSGATAGGVRIDGGEAVVLRHLTVRGVESEGEGAAVLVDRGAVEVRDSILVDAPAALVGAAPEDASMAHSLSFGLLGETLVEATDGGGNLSADPAFVDAEAGDLRLRADSPAVDVADPDAPCELEPPPAAGACRADLGHTGNTADAHGR